MVIARRDIWRGVEESKVAEVTMEQFMEMATSRERRTLKRLNSNPKLKKFIEKVRKIKKENPKKMIKTQMREAIILPEWFGLTFGIYNGKEYKKVEITLHMIGKRLGDFAHSTGRGLHSGPGVGATRGSKFVPLR